jgi:sec-independent protein translocase protein TatB
MDIGWSELMVVGIVALVVIGPKDLPGMFRELGRFTAKIRAMAREFSRAMEQAAKESGVKEAADDLRKATSAKAMGLDAVKSAADRFEKWDPLKNAAKPTTPAAPAAATTATAPAEAAPAAADAPAPGPATAALAEKQAARKAVAAEAAAKLRAVSSGAAELEAELAPPVAKKAPAKRAAKPADAADQAAAKAPGRVRKKADKPATGETA